MLTRVAALSEAGAEDGSDRPARPRDQRSPARRYRASAPIFAILLVFLVSLGVRLDGIDLAATADEGYWVQRTLRFGAALTRGDLTSTFRAGHPGVTVMWTGLLGIGSGRLEPLLSERYTRYLVLERADGYLEAFGAARRAVAVLTAGLVALAVALAWRLLGAGPALAGGALLTLDPYVVGMTRLLHVEALLAPLMTVSVLSGLIVWTGQGDGGARLGAGGDGQLGVRRWRGRAYLLLSAVTGGLALLTKSPAGALAIFFGLISVAGLIGAAGRLGGARLARSTGPLRPPGLARRSIGLLLAWGVVAGLTFVLLFPALWVDPLTRLNQLVQFVALVGLQPHDGNFFLGRPTFDDPGPLYYPVALSLRLSPLVVVGLSLLTIPAARSEERVTHRWLLVFAALYVGLMTLGSKKFDRYLLPALMVLDLLAGVGIWRAATLLADRVGLHRGVAGLAGRVRLALVALCGVGQLGVLFWAQPYPIAYYNPLAGGPERARQVLMVGWGEGLDQAAAYLAARPDADGLRITSSYNHVVRPRFPGTTIPITAYLRAGPSQPPTPEYVVLYVNAVQRRQVPAVAERAMAAGPPEFVARVNGHEYAWVYRVPASEPRHDGALPTDEEVERPEVEEN